MEYKRILGLDIGEKRIGVAVSDLLMLTAQGIESYSRKNDPEDIGYIKKLAEELGAVKIVCGLPINMNGTEGDQAKKTRDFAEMLGQDTGCEIDYFDERLTTASANRTLLEADMSRAKRKKVVDKVAAVYILQAYMDKANRKEV